MEGKTFVGNCLKVVGLNHLARLVSDSNFRAIEVCEHEIDTSEGLNERDFVFKEEIGALSLKLLVRLLLNHNHDVTWLLTGVFISLAMECVLAVVGRALVDHGLEHFLLLHHLLTLACFALVGIVDDFTLTTTIIARTLRLRVHAWAELGHPRDDTATTAGCALLHCTILATFAIANRADSLTVDGNLGCLARIDLLESALEWMHDGLALFGTCRATTSTTTASEHLTQEVIHASTTTTTFFKAILTIAVISLALFAVAEHLVGLLNLLELLLVTTAIRMMGPG